MIKNQEGGYGLKTIENHNLPTYQSNKIPVEKLATSIERWITKTEVHNYFELLFEKHEKKWRNNLKKDHWKSSVARKLLQVHERVKFTEFLERQITDEYETRIYFPQLITYLRLTCFDQLGQPAKWSTFVNWLFSKKSKAKIEKEIIVNSLNTKDPLEISNLTYLGCNAIYGNKNSFFNFVNNVISASQKEILGNSIKIRTTNESHPTLEGKEVTIDDKWNYIYKIRNDFTHNTYSKDQRLNSKKNFEEWIFKERVFEGNDELWISTKYDFQKVLKETIYDGISELIKREYGM